MNNRAAPTEGRTSSSRALSAVVIAVGLLYLFQATSPLRLEHDSVTYFRISFDILGIGSAHSNALPLGYPAVLAALDSFGTFLPAAVVLFNCLCIAAGLVAMLSMNRDSGRNTRLWIVGMSLLSFPMVRSAVMPLAEATFFALAMIALAAMTNAHRKGGLELRLYLVAIVATALAMSVRLAGVALLPALAWTLFQSVTRVAGRRRLTQGIILVAALGFLAAAVSLADSGTMERYTRVFQLRWHSIPLPDRLATQVFGVLDGLGEAILNLPSLRLPVLLPVMRLIGAIALMLLIVTGRRKSVSPAGIFLTFSILLILVWPWRDIRFWMPLIPLLIAQAAQLEWRSRQLIGSVALAWFTVTGGLAIGWLTRQALPRSAFVYRYNPMVTPGYEGRNPTHNADVIGILRRYDPNQAVARGRQLPGGSTTQP